MTTNKKRIIFISIIIAVIVAVCIVGLLYYQRYTYYSEHFYPGTTINGVDCTDMTVEEVEATVQEVIDEYTLIITDREGRSYELTAEQIEMTYSNDGSIEQLMRDQKAIFWIVNINEPANAEVSTDYTYDSDSLRTWFESLECVTDAVAPTDAYEFQGEDGYWYIEPETEGSQMDVDLALSIIEAAIQAGETSLSLEDSGCYLSPSVYSNDESLISDVNEKNKAIELEKYIDEITNVSVTLVVAGDLSKSTSQVTSSTLDQSALKEMIVEDEDGTPIISYDKVYEWVMSWATENDLINDSYLFVTYSGSVVRLKNGVDYGWKLDLDATAEAVYAAVSSKNSTTLSPVVTSVDDGSVLSESTYIEIIIPEQRMILYVNGEVAVDTSVVTGSVANGTTTPSNGVWHIYSKSKNYVLHGYYPDGTLEYETPVDYWMPFNRSKAIGIHDMTSRAAFGGDIYLTDGSHGCINTPYAAAEQIFNLVSVGTKVVVWG